MLSDAERHIVLPGLENLRSLDGFPTADGRETRHGSFLRSGKTSALPQETVAALRGLGVRLVVDLRGADEIEKRPSTLAPEPWLRYENVAVFDGFLLPQTPATVGQMYEEMLNRGPADFARLFRLVLACEGTCLFHCTSGKDRTGLAAMLLEELAGVEDSLIVRDYALTQEYDRAHLEEMQAGLRAKGKEDRARLFTATPDAMETALAHLRAGWGNAAGYLTAGGMNEGEIDALRRRMVE